MRKKRSVSGRLSFATARRSMCGMQWLMWMMIGSLALFPTGCKVVREIETAKQDIHKSMVVWHEDIEPRLSELVKVLGTVGGDIKKDVHEAKAVWERVELSLAEVEKAVSKLEAGFKEDYRDAILVWHKEMESFLSELERVAGTVEGGYKKFAKTYDRLKAGLRSVKVRVTDDVKHNAMVKHVESLMGHVECLEQQHVGGITKPVITTVRSNVEDGVRQTLKTF